MGFQTFFDVIINIFILDFIFFNTNHFAIFNRFPFLVFMWSYSAVDIDQSRENLAK